MLILVTTILGLIVPFIPDLLKLFTQVGDRKHELALMTLRMTQAGQEHLWRMEQINAEADIAESIETHRPQASFGVQLLDKAHDSGMPAWVIVPVFWLFALLDIINGLVRPSIAYAVVGFYMFYRYACIKLAQGVISGNSFMEALAGTWNENDWAILFMVLGYFFGDRVRQKFRQGK